MRIHPIQHRGEAGGFEECDVVGDIACRAGVHGCKARAAEWRPMFRGCVEGDVNRILFKRAFLGLLSRMRTFDWQVEHGHELGRVDGHAALLDVHV